MGAEDLGIRRGHVWRLDEGEREGDVKEAGVRSGGSGARLKVGMFDEV